MGLGIPPLRIDIMLESNPRTSTILVGGLAVCASEVSRIGDVLASLKTCVYAVCIHIQYITIYIYIYVYIYIYI